MDRQAKRQMDMVIPKKNVPAPIFNGVVGGKTTKHPNNDNTLKDKNYKHNKTNNKIT